MGADGGTTRGEQRGTCGVLQGIGSVRTSWCYERAVYTAVEDENRC